MTFDVGGMLNKIKTSIGVCIQGELNKFVELDILFNSIFLFFHF